MNGENSFDKDEALFLSIMYSFHAAAMQQMGKIANPLTGKVERDLDAARGTIDVLIMFQKKTEGNLKDRERRTLSNLVTELQLNFVDESRRAAAAEEKERVPEEKAEVGAEPGAEEAETAPAAPEEVGAEEEKEKVAAEAEAGEEAPERPKKKKAKRGRRPKKKGEG
ncbi:MAG: DUF1844 domain-containing protein [candidate division Zixibacteria bacterium]|nr:DUF1844 domain-containing protein [candidate division Zixibacteria bacterium]